MNARVLVAVSCLALVAAGAASSKPAARCSATGFSHALQKQKLPAAAAATRRRVVDAAIACDYAKLQRIGNERDGLKFSYGTERSAAAYWRAEEARGAKPMAMLVRILRLPVTPQARHTYSWPPAYTDKPTKADWDMLVRAGVLTRKQADSQRLNGNVYYGYRTAIAANGDWQFFVQGD